MSVLKSNIDKSVNFVEDQLSGFLESRYVRKVPEYFICYLSSQTGCNRGCKFCHLTATKQTQSIDSDYQDYMNQALQVFRHYRKENSPAKYMHYNFMARGEALSNKHFLKEADHILGSLGDLAVRDKLLPKFNVSTIIPRDLTQSLAETFKLITPTIYYSLYSIDESFRREWLPTAMPLKIAFEALKDYQVHSKKITKIHFPFIKGENDSLSDMGGIIQYIIDFELACEINIIRYNPFSPEQGQESSEEVINRNVQFLVDQGIKVKMIPRVGFDVNASCGMFVDKK